MSALLFLYWGRPQPFLPCLLRVAGHHPTGLAGNILERNHRNLKVAVFLRVLFGLILFQTETDTDCAPRFHIHLPFPRKPFRHSRRDAQIRAFAIQPRNAVGCRRFLHLNRHKLPFVMRARAFAAWFSSPGTHASRCTARSAKRPRLWIFRPDSENRSHSPCSPQNTHNGSLGDYN